MPKPRPSGFWYLPPLVAGLFYVFVFGFFSPVIPVIFVPMGSLLGALAGLVAYSALKEKGNEKAREWAQIFTAWIGVIMIFLLTELFYCEIVGC
jgi:predicted membrane metal-binding protein